MEQEGQKVEPDILVEIPFRILQFAPRGQEHIFSRNEDLSTNEVAFPFGSHLKYDSD